MDMMHELLWSLLLGVCACVWVCKNCLYILVSATCRVVKALNSNHRVQIQPRSDQSKKTRVHERKKWALCVCVCVFVFANSHQQKIYPTCTHLHTKTQKYKKTDAQTVHHYLLPFTRCIPQLSPLSLSVSLQVADPAKALVLLVFLVFFISFY